MEHCRTPTNMKNYTFNRTPTMKERRWNTLNVSNTSVRCSTPIFGDFRSPNLSPIVGMGSKKSPVSRFEELKKPPIKHLHHHQKRNPKMIKRSELKPPIFVLPQPQEEVMEQKQRELERERKSNSNSSLDIGSDDSNLETSLTVESRRRSVTASNHSYVVNHARNVEQVLVHIGLESYVRHFEKAHIDMVTLASMGRDDLAKIGLKADEDCNKIMDAINAL
ncbi:protein matrimony [Drosophila kikkawai]|uniref:Protein matrimony n=1 Tax=Drosophila kikkawai TaxID=30033 RepID=A0A6P4IIY1_DROKI|nr:protein matrimony [Drosophila kikkawai]